MQIVEMSVYSLVANSRGIVLRILGQVFKPRRTQRTDSRNQRRTEGGGLLSKAFALWLVLLQSRRTVLSASFAYVFHERHHS